MASFWNKEMETLSRDELRKIQGERLKATIKRVYANVPYYAEKMKAAGITPDDINTADDLSKLPFTYKADLRENYPFGTFAVPLEQVVRVHASSGTTGKQTVVGYTQNDLEIWKSAWQDV
jgi:phenylacetate-CoA ligase